MGGREGAAPGRGSVGECWAAQRRWDVSVRAAAEVGKYVGTWVHLPGMPKNPFLGSSSSEEPGSGHGADLQTALTLRFLDVDERQGTEISLTKGVFLIFPALAEALAGSCGKLQVSP